ncbi:MAG: HD domain-containing protein [Balneola sp.]|nr:MAG: HD domain-containing protein [Balneola sp.]
MKDVKSYLNLVGSRIGKAFSLQEFSVEDELKFWSHSAEHMSRAKPPSFRDIVRWMDILYKAPVHIVYRKKGDELFLFKRFVNLENLIGKESKSDLNENEKEAVSSFEQQVQNLQQKKKWYPELNEHGISSNSVGNCEHIPLYDEDSNVWGLYIIGPNTRCPEVIVPRISIVGRLLSIWLSNIEKEEEGQKDDYKNKMGEIISELGSGALNTEALSRLLLRYLISYCESSGGAVVETSRGTIDVIYSENLDDDIIGTLLSENELAVKGEKTGKITSISLDKLGAITSIHFEEDDSSGLILLKEPQKNEESFTSVAKQLAQLFNYRDENAEFSNHLLDTYYQMLRSIELQRETTKHHTPRVIAFAERFAMIFGLDDSETEILKLTAKLHDIGYVGSLSVESEASIGSELSHPLTGYKLIDQLPIHDDVKQGVLTHQEWVNGEGSPQGLEASEISWTGKIIAVFEYIVEFIESNKDDTSKTPEEWIDLLSQNIIERADLHFDMVIVPTVLELVKMMGWEMCIQLGVD